jgi:hypothetical protein
MQWQKYDILGPGTRFPRRARSVRYERIDGGPRCTLLQRIHLLRGRCGRTNTETHQTACEEAFRGRATSFHMLILDFVPRLDCTL